MTGAPLATALGYMLTGGIFVFAGIDHARRFGAVRATLAGREWPVPGVMLALAFEVARAAA